MGAVPGVPERLRNERNDFNRKPYAMRDSTGFARAGSTERRPPFGHPPLGGGVQEGRGPAPSASDRSEVAGWVRDNLPACSAFAAAFKAEFEGLRLTFASEAGHTIGKPSEAPGFSVSGDDLMPFPRKVRP